MISKKKEKEILNLPVYTYEDEIINRLKNENVLIIIGETGCGKTTQIPKILYNNKMNENKGIVITQPRRVAAISLAHRVAEEVNLRLPLNN